MKNSMIRSLALLGVSVMMTLSVAAQDLPKEKITDKEDKYKSEDLKMKDKKDKKDKYKADDLKIKDKKDEMKYKSAGLKVKDDKDERKIKGRVRPMPLTHSEETELKTGETQVMTREHPDPIVEESVTPEPPVADQVPVPQVSAPARKAYAHRYAARKNVHKPIAARTATNRPKYIVRTKVVRDTVFVPSQPETVVTTQYVHDTVSLTRVDTVIKVETQNTYSGYRVPQGNFKKVKLKKDKDSDEVWMKTKE